MQAAWIQGNTGWWRNFLRRVFLPAFNGQMTFGAAVLAAPQEALLVEQCDAHWVAALCCGGAAEPVLTRTLIVLEQTGNWQR